MLILLRTCKRYSSQSLCSALRAILNFYERAQLDPKWHPETAYLRFPMVVPTLVNKQELCTAGKDLGFGVSGLYPSPAQHYIDERDAARFCELLHRIIAGAHPSVTACNSRVTDRPLSFAETREAGA